MGQVNECSEFVFLPLNASLRLMSYPDVPNTRLISILPPNVHHPNSRNPGSDPEGLIASLRLTSWDLEEIVALAPEESGHVLDGGH